jgi:hypothetical protein
VNPAWLYLAAIYALLVLLIRRFTPLLRWRDAGFFYLLVVLFLFKPLTGPYVNVPADYVRRIEPWSAFAKPVPGSNSEINDVILQMVPWAHQVRQSWRAGQPPLWNENAGGGYPLLANGQSAGLSPLRLLALPLPLGESLSFEAAMKLLMGMTFAFLYARRRWHLLPALAVAVSWGFSSFLVVWLHFPHTTVAAVLPALFLAIDLLWQKPDLPRYAFATGVFAFLLLGGHPESVAHSVFGAGLYTLFLWFAGGLRHWRPVAYLSAAGVTALLLAAPFLFPFLEALPRSQRWDWVHSSLHRIAPESAQVIVPFFQPGFYGSIREGNIWGAGIAETLGGYAGVLGFFAWFGVLAYVLTERRWRDPVVFYLLAVPPLMLIVLRWTPVATGFYKLPLFNVAANQRLRFVLCWAFAVLLGAVLQKLLEGRRMPLLVTAGAAIAGLSAALALHEYPHEPAWEHAVMTTVPRLTVIGVALIAAFVTGRARSATLSLLVLLVALDLWAFGRAWNPVLPRTSLYPRTPIIDFLAREQRRADEGQAPPFRMTASGSAFFPNSAAMFDLEDVRAHDPMAYGKTLGALRVFTGYSSFDYFGVLKSVDEPYLDYLNVAYLVSSPVADHASPRWEQVYEGRDGKVYRNRQVLPRFFAARNVLVAFDDEVRMREIVQNADWANLTILKRVHTSLVDQVREDLLTHWTREHPVAQVAIRKSSDAAFELDIDAPRWSLIVSSQANFPGWKVFRNGSERLKIIEVNTGFIGFLVPPGRSSVEVTYRPRSFTWGVVVAASTLLFLVLALVRRRRIHYS